MDDNDSRKERQDSVGGGSHALCAGGVIFLKVDYNKIKESYYKS